MNRTFNFLLLGVVLGLAGCSSPPPQTTRSEAARLRANRSGQEAFARGNLAQSVRVYEQAWQEARRQDDPVAIGNAAYNLAAALAAGGELERARSLLSAANLDFARVGIVPGDVLLLEAKIALWQGNHDQARALSTAVLAQGGLPATQEVQAALLQGQVACARGELEPARAAWRHAARAASALTDPAVQAGVETLAGGVAFLEKKFNRAGVTFDRASALWQSAEQYGEMARALARAGESYAAGGEGGAAAHRFYRAARSALAQERLQEATRWGEAALEQAQLAQENVLTGEVRQLLQELKKQ